MRTLIVLTVSLALAACGEVTPEAEPTTEPALEQHEFEDADVTRIHSHMIGTIAPDAGWERSRYLEFDWAVNRGEGQPPSVRAHRLDRWEGRARARFDTDMGELIALFDLDDPTSGRAWIDGEEVEGDDARALLQRAYSAHVNDSYWLLMPYKWTDPGVTARYVGEEEEEGRTFEVVELSFEDETGLTPNNMYRAFVNPESGRMERWHFLRDADANPSPSDWTEWTRVGPIELSMNRESGGEVRIFFSHLLVSEEVPEGAFDTP